MKEIIYLDTNFLNSFLAQINNGLPTSTSREDSEEVKNTSEESSGHRSATSIEATFKSGEFEIPLILKSPSGEVKGVWRPGEFSEEKAIASQTEFAKEIITTQMHDNALEEFINYLDRTDTTLAVSDSRDIGTYINKTTNFKIFDFKYLKKIMDVEALTRMIFYETEEQVNKFKLQLNSAPKDKRSGKEYQVFKSQLTATEEKLKKSKETFKNQLEFVQQALSYIDNISSCTTYLITDGFILPMKEEFLRERGSDLSFKYGSTSSIDISFIGKITGEIPNTNMGELNPEEMITRFHEMLYIVLISLNLIKKGDKIVSPVAIYFE